MIIYIYITSVGNLRGTRVHLSEFRNWFAKNGFSFSFYEERKKSVKKFLRLPEKVFILLKRWFVLSLDWLGLAPTIFGKEV